MVRTRTTRVLFAKPSAPGLVGSPLSLNGIVVLGPTVLRINLRARVCRREQDPQNRSLMQDLLAGAVSGAITKTAIAPLERVKILLQIQVRTGHGRVPCGSDCIPAAPGPVLCIVLRIASFGH